MIYSNILEIYKEGQVMMIAGLEKHTDLQGYIDKIERRKIERETEDIKLQLGLCTEYIVGQYLKEYPLCVGEDLFSNIENLKEVLSEETVNLLHSLRKARNDGGAHISKGKKYTFEETIELYNELLNYLPDFLKVFPTPSEKPLPKAGASANLGFVIDFESIQPLELHPNWREAIGYNDMLKLKSLPDYNEFVDWVLKEDFDTCDAIYPWLWCIELIDELNLIIKKDEKEYLNIQALTKCYYNILDEILKRNPIEPVFKDWSSSRYDFENIGYYTDSCSVPGIIQKYFPGSAGFFVPGKGFEWGPYIAKYTNNEIDAFVNGKDVGIKENIKEQVYWYTVGRAEEEEKERQMAEAQAKKWEAEQRAKEEARQAQMKKAAAESKARREKEVAEARKQQVKKGAKGFGILYIVVIVLCLLLFVFNLLGGAKLAVDLLIIAVIVYFVIKRKRKDE